MASKAYFLNTTPGPLVMILNSGQAVTLAAWGKPGDTFRFYEINPAVQDIANQWFTYLRDSKAKTEIVLGDARIQMERELASGQAHDFDVIAVDAFSSDAIPLHLLTAECGEIYRRRLVPGGFLLRLRFGQHSPELLERLQSLAGVREVRTSDDTAVDVYADRGGSLLPEIATLAAAAGVELHDVHISEPSLENLFLHHTGRSLRE